MKAEKCGLVGSRNHAGPDQNHCYGGIMPRTGIPLSCSPTL